MKDNFPLFFKRVLEDEGAGYEDVPGDNGGPTKCGITIADVARFNGVRCPERNAPGWEALVAKVQALDTAQAAVIYKQFYWDSCRADFLPSGIDYSVVDYAVNSGTHRAIPVLGNIVGVPGSTVTDAMLDAVDKAIPRDLINSYQDERKAFLEHISQIPHNAKFRTGWLAREARVRRVALSLSFKSATDDEGPGITQGHPKALGEHPNDETLGIMPPIDALPAPPHPTKIAVKSPTTWIASAIATILAHLTGVASAAADSVSELFGNIPKVASDTQELIAPTNDILGILHARSHELEFAVGVACLVVIVVRNVHLHRGKT